MQCRAGVLRGWWGGRAGKLLIRQKQSLNECGEMKREGSVPRPAARGGHSQRQRNDLGVGKLSEEKKKKSHKKKILTNLKYVIISRPTLPVTVLMELIVL